MSTASQTQEKKFGDDTGLLHQVALSLRAVCKDESEARAVATKLAHDRPFLTKVVNLAIGKPKRGRSTKGLINSDLLEPVTMVSTPAVSSFKAKDKFKESKTVDGMKMWGTGSNFQRHFMGKVETDTKATQLRSHKLRKGAVDPAIIEALGGEGLVETSLAQMWEMMKKQANGEEGDLLVNGYANIFYVPDTEGKVWAVDCFWLAGLGWCVEAFALSDPDDWVAGNQVFSR